MSWIEKLHETYQNCSGLAAFDANPLTPISHTTQQAHIEIVIDGVGCFRRASVIAKDHSTTLIPCTEKSGGRAGSKPVNHPLCDKLQYVAGDFIDFGGSVTSGFAKNPQEPHQAFVKDLQGWVDADPSQPKLNAVLAYVQKGKVIADLVQNKILPVHDGDTEIPQLLKKWMGEKDQTPEIFKVLPNTQTPEAAFIRWVVESDGDVNSAIWEDTSLAQSWIDYYSSKQEKMGLCMVSGEEGVLAEQHPAKIRHAGDKAKLISSNDKSGYTYRGRFIGADQVVGVGFEVTQQAHNALRWLINRQGYRNGDQVIVTWSVGGHAVPDPFQDTLALFMNDDDAVQGNTSDTKVDVGDVGQSFAIQLKKALAGYRAKLDPTDDIVVMGLDSATPGRMAIIYYREMNGDDFLDRIESWHEQCAWPQNFGKEKHFIGVPAPRDIAEAAYGRRLDDKLRKATVERLLPCIIDGQTIPRDLVLSTAHRASNRVGMDHWEWEKNLGIACSLFKGYYKERSYQMALEQERISRDYLYGRLLAIADNIENYALTSSEKHRDTMAGRLMQRFSDRPFSTWRNIELALGSYKSRLRATEKTAGFLWKREKLLDEVMCSFQNDDFTNDRALSGEFLLGFHCQRNSLFGNKKDDESKGEDK